MKPCPRCRSAVAAWACAVGLCGAAAAQIPPESPRRPAPPGRTAIYSADRRFRVSGMTSAENMVLARKLADLARKVEDQTGQPVPLRHDQVLGVMVQSASAPDSRVLKVQGWDDGRFYQRLVVPGAVRLDEEDLLEAASWLMLNRYAAEYTPPNQRAGMGAAAPDWIAVGLAQNAQPALRARNAGWLARELDAGRPLPLAQVVKLETLPPGRWREKAYAGAAVEFLFPRGDLNAWAAVSKAIGTRTAIDPAWLRAHCPVLSAGKPEEAWREFLEARARTRAVEAWSDRSLHVEEKLLQTLNFRPRDVADDIPNDVPAELFARDLIAYRGQAWTGPVAAALGLQVQSLELGAPPALGPVLAAYGAFFAQLALPPAEKTAWWKSARKETRKTRPADDAAWELALNQLWQRAERTHQAFLENHQSRKRYVDSFDRPEAGAADAPFAAEDGAPRTRLQQYLDAAESGAGPGAARTPTAP